MSYEQGFLDALFLVEKMLFDKGLLNDEIREILEEVRIALADERAKYLKMRFRIV